MIGKFGLVVTLWSEIPRAVPLLWFLMNRMVELFQPLPALRTLYIRLGSMIVIHFAGHEGLIAVCSKVGREADMRLEKFWLPGNRIVIVVEASRGWAPPPEQADAGRIAHGALAMSIGEQCTLCSESIDVGRV